jgi:hypothetical protein
MSLLDSKNIQVITINGKEFCNEEAASMFESMTKAEQDNLKSLMTEYQIIVYIYSSPKIGFNYI